MTNKVKRVIEVARARATADPERCVVCHGRVSHRDASIRLHAGTAHARCATYRARRPRA